MPPSHVCVASSFVSMARFCVVVHFVIPNGNASSVIAGVSPFRSFLLFLGAGDVTQKQLNLAAGERVLELKARRV